MYLRHSVSSHFCCSSVPFVGIRTLSTFDRSALVSCINAGGDMVSGVLFIVTNEFVWGYIKAHQSEPMSQSRMPRHEMPTTLIDELSRALQCATLLF